MPKLKEPTKRVAISIPASDYDLLASCAESMNTPLSTLVSLAFARGMPYVRHLLSKPDAVSAPAVKTAQEAPAPAKLPHQRPPAADAPAADPGPSAAPPTERTFSLKDSIPFTHYSKLNKTIALDAQAESKSVGNPHVDPIPDYVAAAAIKYKKELWCPMDAPPRGVLEIPERPAAVAAMDLPIVHLWGFARAYAIDADDVAKVFDVPYSTVVPDDDDGDDIVVGPDGHVYVTRPGIIQARVTSPKSDKEVQIINDWILSHIGKEKPDDWTPRVI